MRGRCTRALIAGLVALLAVGVVDPAAVAGSGIRPTPSRTGLSRAQVAVVDRVVELFEQAGLRLPPVDIVGHTAAEACQGRDGRHVRVDGRSSVHVCVANADRGFDILVIHELAHAWEHATLTDEQRSAFLTWRRLPQWRVTDADSWYLSGAEHVAEILVWGLRDRPYWFARLEGYDCEDLAFGFEMVTGRPPLYGYADHC